MEVHKISIIGGDLKSIRLAQLLERNFEVYTYGLEKADELKEQTNIRECKCLEDATEQGEIIISSIPFSSNRNKGKYTI